MAAERQAPGGGFVNEMATAQRQTPGGSFVNETAATASLPTLSSSTYKPGTLTADGWQPRVTAT